MHVHVVTRHSKLESVPHTLVLLCHLQLRVLRQVGALLAHGPSLHHRIADALALRYLLYALLVEFGEFVVRGELYP